MAFSHLAACLVASIDLQPAGYDPARGKAFFAEMLDRVRDLPGVDAASVATRVPLGFGGHTSMTAAIDGYTPAPNEEL